MNLFVDLVVYAFMAFIAVTIFSLFYEKLKPIVDKLLPPKRDVGLLSEKVACPECGGLLRIEEDGLYCDLCGFKDVVKYEPQ